MTDKELWGKFCTERDVPDREYEAWSFGDDPDLLADLVLKGEKTATSSAYILYGIEGEPLPAAGEYSVILNSDGQAVCIIRTTKVFVVPFGQVSEEFAFKEGEGDKSLSYWRKVHKAFFSAELKKVGEQFDMQTMVVCEEFILQYP